MSLGSQVRGRKGCRSEREGLLKGPGVCRGQRCCAENLGPLEDAWRSVCVCVCVRREDAKSMWVLGKGAKQEEAEQARGGGNITS